MRSNEIIGETTRKAAEDTDLPAGGDLTITEVSSTEHGAAILDGTDILYTPYPNYVGTDTFTYTVRDEDGLEASATVTVNITSVDDAPIAEDDTATMNYGQADIEIDVLANDSDNDPNPDYDPDSVDVPEAVLLGERQLKFLDTWGQDWKGADMKVALSQTIFCGGAHIHGKVGGRLHADLDSNGWPMEEAALPARAAATTPRGG